MLVRTVFVTTTGGQVFKTRGAEVDNTRSIVRIEDGNRWSKFDFFRALRCDRFEARLRAARPRVQPSCQASDEERVSGTQGDCF